MNAESSCLDREYEHGFGWLEEWRSAEREPVFFSDEPEEWRVIEAWWERRALVFRYAGGSEPGLARRVIPRMVFRVAGCRGLYFSGWCAVRAAVRTFRVDRVCW